MNGLGWPVPPRPYRVQSEGRFPLVDDDLLSRWGDQYTAMNVLGGQKKTGAMNFVEFVHIQLYIQRCRLVIWGNPA